MKRREFLVQSAVAELGPCLATPEGRVHFADEHTSPWIGSMQGALQSGLRAAWEIIEGPA
jgi:monoamine oxidase